MAEYMSFVNLYLNSAIVHQLRLDELSYALHFTCF